MNELFSPETIVSFTVPGEAVPYARTGGHGKIRFTPAKQRHNANLIRLAAERAMANRPPHEGAVELVVSCVSLIPASWSKRKKAEALHGPKVTKPDLDNLLKQIKDALKEVVWRDDAQVARLMAAKSYGAVAQTIVTARAL